MPTPATPSASQPPGDDRNLVNVDQTYAGAGFEDRVRIFWERNSGLVTGVLIAVIIAIAAKGGWDYFSVQREKVIEQAYASANGKEQLQAFIAANPLHPLAAVAELRLADGYYAANAFGDAIAAYDSAAAMFKTGPLASRARLGNAMAKLQGGRAADGEAALKAIAADPNELKAFRAEAAYHLASYAFASHRPDAVKTYTQQLMQIDPASPWAQRAIQLQAEASGPGAPAPAANAGPVIKLPLPGN